MRAHALLTGTLIASAAISGAATAGDRAEWQDRVARVFQADQDFKMARVAEPVRSVIIQQVDAVREANADVAFASVAPRIKEMFATGENYLQFFRTQFPGIATGRIISFGDLRETSFGMAQAVRISDKKGEPWLAFFLMDQVDSEWRIANVVAVKMPSTEV